MHVDNDVAIIGGKAFAQFGLSAQCNHLPRNETARHRDHLNGQRELAQHIHQLAGVAHADEFPARCRDDLLACQRSAAALDHVHVAGNLVSAVHIHRQVARVVQRQHLDAMPFQPFRRSFRAGDRAANLVPDLCQFVYEEIGGGAGAHADDAIVWDICDRGPGNCLFHLILSHRSAISLSVLFIRARDYCRN